MPLPNNFLNIIHQQLGNETDVFLNALEKPSPTSIRFNPKKKTISQSPIEPFTQSLNHPISHKIPWSTEGVYLAERPVFTLDPAFHAGAYYVQEASSMFIEEIVRQCVDIQQDIAVLDLCAAPGGKSTLLASILSENSLIIANEVIKNRVDILKDNMIKWGYPNVYVSNHDPEDFTPKPPKGGAILQTSPLGGWGLYDIVLVDAPCSGEGLFRKDPDAINEWSVDNIQLCAARQKRILSEAMKLVKSDGFLIFSTCTYNDVENIGNTQFVLQNADFQEIKLNVNPEWHITLKEHGYQFYPHKTEGEGFYCCVFKKQNVDNITAKINATLPYQKLPKKHIDMVKPFLIQPDKFEFFIKPNGMIFVILKKHINRISLIDKVLKRKSIGLELGEIKGQDFIPSHDLALSIEIAPSTEGVNLSKSEALKFLKKENIEVNDAPQGWVLARYEGLNLGWMKVLKNRINNYLPKDFRIRMDLPRDN
jgi:16S rRNA C967 or C1407 C5-methylase (RsmB/RsmF family)/NOL1/NOP2/fmu family ribosome biogenesis protein